MGIEIKEFRTPEADAVEGYILRSTTTGFVYGLTLAAERGPEDAEAFLAWCLERHGEWLVQSFGGLLHEHHRNDSLVLLYREWCAASKGALTPGVLRTLRDPQDAYSRRDENDDWQEAEEAELVFTYWADADADGPWGPTHLGLSEKGDALRVKLGIPSS